MGILVQVISTILLSISCLNLGIILTWPSSTILLFKSENTTLHRPMTDFEISLFSSVTNIASFIAQPLIVLGILDKLGLKRTTILTSLCFVIGWSIIAVTDKVEAILAAEAIKGCAMVTYLVVSIYISESAQGSIRGTLVSVPISAFNAGGIVSYFLGGVLEYHIMVYSCLSSAVVGVVVITLLEESPVTLMSNGKVEEAKKSLAFYRQSNTNSEEVLTEINNIRRSLKKQEDTQSLTGIQEIDDTDTQIREKSWWELLKSTPSIRRQLYLVMLLNCTYFYQGLPCIQVFAVPIFSMIAIESISPSTCSIVLGILILVSVIIATFLIDKIGRRPLEIYSSVVSGICCLILGIQLMTDWFPKWMFLVLIYVFSIAHTVGPGTVTFVASVEVFSPKVKSKLYMVSCECMNLSSFSVMFLFSSVVQAFGYAPMFIFFSIICVATAVYCHYNLPETRGLPAYAIQELFINNLLKPQPKLKDQVVHLEKKILEESLECFHVSNVAGDRTVVVRT